jgi:hypothetical protein
MRIFAILFKAIPSFRAYIFRACPLRCPQGSGYTVLPLVGAAHHASRRVPPIPHAG